PLTLRPNPAETPAYTATGLPLPRAAKGSLVACRLRLGVVEHPQHHEPAIALIEHGLAGIAEGAALGNGNVGEPHGVLDVAADHIEGARRTAHHDRAMAGPSIGG